MSNLDNKLYLTLTIIQNVKTNKSELTIYLHFTIYIRIIESSTTITLLSKAYKLLYLRDLCLFM